MGPEKMEALLKETIETAKRKKLVTPAEFERVNVDTTVQGRMSHRIESIPLDEVVRVMREANL